jgi:hypothetical protein
MKTFITFLFILCTLLAFGQKKKTKDQPQKDLQATVDTLTKANDSLILVNKNLTAKSDSLSAELQKYFGLYTVIRDKVVKKDFDPDRMSAIIDSLQAGRDSLTLKAAAAAIAVPAADSSQAYVIDSLKRETQGLLYTVNLLRGKPAKFPTVPKEFVGTWSVVLRKLKVTGQSPLTGIVDITDEPAPKTGAPLELNPVTYITFVDSEIAEFTFRNGQKAKCFYAFNNFSPTKSYTIDFKGTQVDLRIYVMYTLLGPRISFEIPGTQGIYYFGNLTQ